MTQAEKLSEAIKWLDTRWVLHPQNRVPKLKEEKEWVGLTDEERLEFKRSVPYCQFDTAWEFAERVQKATEAKLKEKNS